MEYGITRHKHRAAARLFLRDSVFLSRAWYSGFPLAVIFGGGAVIASVVTGMVAIWKEKGSAVSILSVIVGAFSFVCYVV